MKEMSVGELKTQFSSVLEDIKHGESIIINYGRRKERIGVIVPYQKFIAKKKRQIGVLEGKASFRIHSDFKISEEELLSL